MKSAFITEAGRMEIRETEVPSPGINEALIRITNTGICGSDVHYYEHGKLGDNVIRAPHIPGHEASGIIVETSSKNSRFKPGDRIVIEPGIPCFTCDFCRKGIYNLCDNMAFLSVPGYDGTMREYITYDERGLFSLPDSISLTDAALIEPLAVGFNAAVTAGIKPGSSVCITGAGPIGLTALEAAGIMGASTIMITDTDDYRLETALSHNTTAAVNIMTTDPIDAGMELTGGQGFDFVLDATGIPSAMESCIPLAAKNGTIVFIGLGEDEMRLSGYRMVKKQLTIKAVNRYANHFQPVIQLLAADRYNLKGFISHEFNFGEVVDAFSFATDAEKKKMKVMINF